MMKINIQREDDSYSDYWFDEEVVVGLYITGGGTPVIDNCKEFGITTEIPPDKAMNTKITIIRNLAILTITFSNKEGLQYLIGPDLLLPELDSILEDEMPEVIKKNIIHCFFLANKEIFSNEKK